MQPDDRHQGHAWRNAGNSHAAGRDSATDPAQRGRGYGSTLVREVTRRLGEDGVRGVYLHSEVGAAFYGALGYRATDARGPDAGSVCMVYTFKDEADLVSYAPDYF